MTLLLVIHTGNLSAYYSNAYNYNSYKLIDLKGLSEFIVKYRETGAEYYSDTVTSQLKYFPWEKGAGNLWTLLTEWEKDKPGFSVKLPDKVLIHIGGIYRKNVNAWNGFFESLQKHYVLEECFHSHGAQAFLFSRTIYADKQINKDGEILFPSHLYTLPYDDMEVKGISLGKGRHFEMDRKAPDKIIELAQHEKFKSIHLYGHMAGCPDIKYGEQIGSVTVTDIKGNKREFPLRNEINIGDWKAVLGENSITQFQKRLSL